MSERVERARRIGDECQAFTAVHEQEAHNGERCGVEAVNLIAYLCHRLGIHMAKDASDDVLAEFRELVVRSADYDATHAEHHV